MTAFPGCARAPEHHIGVTLEPGEAVDGVRARRDPGVPALGFGGKILTYGMTARRQVENVLMGPEHNALLAEREYGREVMRRFRGSPGRVSEAPWGYGAVPGASRPLEARVAVEYGCPDVPSGSPRVFVRHDLG